MPNAGKEKGGRKINKSSILMAHFRGTLPLSLGPDISIETTPQPQSSIKSSHWHTQRIRVGSMSNQMFQFGPPLGRAGSRTRRPGEAPGAHRLHSVSLFICSLMFGCLCLRKLTEILQTEFLKT